MWVWLLSSPEQIEIMHLGQAEHTSDVSALYPWRRTWCLPAGELGRRRSVKARSAGLLPKKLILFSLFSKILGREFATVQASHFSSNCCY